MIEVREVPIRDVPERQIYNPYRVFIDDVELSTDEAYVSYPSGSADRTFEVSIYDEFSSQVLGHRFSNLSNQIRKLSIFRPQSLMAPDIYAHIVVIRVDDERYRVDLRCTPNGSVWKHLWSIKEYVEEFRQVVERNKALEISWSEEEELIPIVPSFTLHLPAVEDATLTIEEVTSSHLGTVNQLHESVEASLVAKLRGDSVVMQFDFPEEVKVPCEQYLLYFVQFLKDLGVEARAELQHEAGQVLFAVTPADKDEALDKIRLALETYLRLSASPITESSINNEIAVQRLTGEIQALQSRLTLARAEIQYKDKAIDAMQFVIDRQRLSGDVMVESLKNVTPKPPDKDKEAVLGGIVEITKYEGKGVNVNFAELFRRFREYLAKKK